MDGRQTLDEVLANIIESLPDATFVIDRDKRVVAWNRACEVLTGVPKEEILGQGDYAYAIPLSGERRPVLIDLLDISSPEMEAGYKFIERRGDAVYAEAYRPRLNGGQGAHVWGVAAPLFDKHGQRCGAIEVMRDVTERIRVEQALRESELRYRTLFETAGDAILLMRGDCFIDCNARALALFGCAREQLIGSAPYAFSPPTQPDGQPSDEEARAKIGLALAEGAQVFEWEHCRLDGTPLMAEVSLNALELGGEVLVQALVRDITVRKGAEKALRRSEERFRVIMENLADLVAVLDRDGRRIYNSPSYQGILGDVSLLRGSSSFDEIHPDDRLRVREAFEETVRTGNGQRLEYRLVDQHGQIRYIESQGSAIRDDRGRASNVLVVSRDVTDRRLAEERIEASERKYRELVQYANSIILHWTRDGRVIFLNEFGQRFFGYTEDEIRGRHVVGTIVPESESSGRDLTSLMDHICADPADFEQNVNENMRRDGERVWIAWTNKVVLDGQGQVAEILSVGTDVTEQRRAEDALRELNASLERRVAERTEELAEARDRAEESDRLKSAFLATMSHELRTPLNSIIGFTGILLQGLAGPLNEEQLKQLRMIQTSGRHLLALVSDVLDISRIEAGEIDVACDSFDVLEAVQRVIQTVAPAAEKKAVRLVTEVAPDVGALASDRRRVEQILLNLVGNAVKFTERGEVALSCERTLDKIVFRVRDTGIGIRPEHLGRIFKPFHQVDTGLSRLHEGTGLGLAICRRLTERLGGSISVESEWGVGSTFTVVLPILPGARP
jgi:PAS domain S-box-containing protein